MSSQLRSWVTSRHIILAVLKVTATPEIFVEILSYVWKVCVQVALSTLSAVLIKSTEILKLPPHFEGPRPKLGCFNLGNGNELEISRSTSRASQHKSQPD